ncbi:hypothetical protein ACG93R_03085 [Acinetobacter guillouiae]|uniref:hypothetical protein n=1 Tax=Acinetobacter guillouiae TaxID=106649 RepID=UPI003AF5B12D
MAESFWPSGNDQTIICTDLNIKEFCKLWGSPFIQEYEDGLGWFDSTYLYDSQLINTPIVFIKYLESPYSYTLVMIDEQIKDVRAYEDFIINKYLINSYIDRRKSEYKDN